MATTGRGNAPFNSEWLLTKPRRRQILYTSPLVSDASIAAWNDWIFEAASGATAFTYSGSGTVTLSGTSPLVRIKVATPLGGVSFTGTATLARTKELVASGQVVFSGSAAASFVGGGGGTAPRARVFTGTWMRNQ